MIDFMLLIDKADITQRKTRLETAKQTLKQRFVGIDTIIDDLIAYIQVWYLLPELLMRPVIVNLWGMTGVGKTDLVRQLVKELEFQERFAEIELSNVDQTFWRSSVSAILDRHELNDTKPCIVLFDEIQRFNTLDADGKPLAQTKFMDFWKLLSDGQLIRSDQEAEEIENFLARHFMERKRRRKRQQSGEDTEYSSDFLLSSYELLSFKKTLNLDIDLEALFELSEDELIDILLTAKRKKTLYEPINHAQTLIIISGNLDEAYYIARQATEAEVDADIFHALTSKITIMDVKAALLQKFRPEQVARFGNIHLIYPSLRRRDFELLIQREIKRIKTDTLAKTGITLQIDNSIAALIYRNGVFPVQGVRPVFSSITDILEVNLSQLLLDALIHDHTHIRLHYDAEQRTLIATLEDRRLLIPFIGKLDKIRDNHEPALTVNISVHEAGHAVAYMVLFGLVPVQLKSRVASYNTSGFTFPHQIYRTRQTLLAMSQVHLAGGLAEELCFGEQYASLGRAQDREIATELVIDYVRRYGFDEQFQATYVLEYYPHQMNRHSSDVTVEFLVKQLVHKTRQLLETHQALLEQLASMLATHGQLNASEIAAVAIQHGLSVTQQEEDYMHMPPYTLPTLTPSG